MLLPIKMLLLEGGGAASLAAGYSATLVGYRTGTTEIPADASLMDLLLEDPSGTEPDTVQYRVEDAEEWLTAESSTPPDFLETTLDPVQGPGVLSVQAVCTFSDASVRVIGALIVIGEEYIPPAPALLYFVVAQRYVYSMPVDGSEAPTQLFDEGSNVVRQIYVDAVNDHLYYARLEASGVNCGIKRRTLSTGGDAVLLYNVANCWGVRPDVANDRIFYSTGDNVIGTVDLNGANQANIYTGVSNPAGLDYDPVDNRLYAALQGTGRITRGTPAGAARVTYDAASSTNFDWVSHNGVNSKVYSGGRESATTNGRLQSYAEAFTASDGTQTDILGINIIRGAVWDPETERVFHAEDRVIKVAEHDGANPTNIRDVDAEVVAGDIFNLALEAGAAIVSDFRLIDGGADKRLIDGSADFRLIDA